MIEIEIPGFRTYKLQYLVADYNGTLACDGIPIPGVKELLEKLAEDLEIHVVTADTFGKVQKEMEDMPITVVVLPAEGQVESKQRYIKNLGSQACAALGNGRNDRLMLEEAALGIAIVGPECAAAETVGAADVVSRDIISALELMSNPLRLAATLRV